MHKALVELERYFIMIEDSLIILNLYATNNIALKYIKQKLAELWRVIIKFTGITEFDTEFNPVSNWSISRQKSVMIEIWTNDQ